MGKSLPFLSPMLRNWLFHPPIGVGLVIVLMLLAAGLINQHRVGTSAANHQLHVAHDSPALAVATHPPAANPNPDRKEWRNERDLEAQQGMARWAMLLFIATVAGLFLLAATLLETREAARAAWGMVEEGKRATEAAIETARHSKAALVLETRPYIVLDNFNYEQTIHDYQANFVFKNFGKTPADIVHMKGNIVYLLPGEVLNPEDRRFHVLADYGNPIILPSDQIVPNTSIHLDEAELLRHIDIKSTRAEMGSVVVILRIDYVAVIGDTKEQWHTQAGYHLEFVWTSFIRMFRRNQIRSLTSLT